MKKYTTVLFEIISLEDSDVIATSLSVLEGSDGDIIAFDDLFI